MEKKKYRIRYGEPYTDWIAVQEKRWFLFIPYWKNLELFWNRNPFNTVTNQGVAEAREYLKLLESK